jgi:hypothetical protein
MKKCRWCKREVKPPDLRCARCRARHSEAVKIGMKKRAARRIEEDEPTEAELEAIIAEQSKNLPSWWGNKR